MVRAACTHGASYCQAANTNSFLNLGGPLIYSCPKVSRKNS